VSSMKGKTPKIKVRIPGSLNPETKKAQSAEPIKLLGLLGVLEIRGAPTTIFKLSFPFVFANYLGNHNSE
jgi:hypothetical protein